MSVIPQWQGVRHELQLLQAAWRELPDNPLWILARHTHANAAPRVAKRRRANVALGSLIVAGLYALSVAAVLGVSGQFEPEAIVFITLGFGVAIAGLTLLSCVLNLSNRAQAWLGCERGDAKHTSLARMDPLLSLSLLTPREVVAAALRELLPTALLGTGVATVAGFAALVTAAAEATRWTQDNDRLLLVLSMAPLTIGSVALAGIGGGVVLTLLSFCVGLNSGSSLQRSILALMLAFHQLVGIQMSMSYLGVPAIGGGVFDFPLIPVVFAVLYLLAAAWLGVHVITTVRGASAGWLAMAPMTAVFGFWLCSGVLALLNIGVTIPGADAIWALALELAALWFSINLFVPGCVPTVLCIGETNLGEWSAQGAMLLNFIAVLTLLGVLLPLAYRAALACAALRLRGTE